MGGNTSQQQNITKSQAFNPFLSGPGPKQLAGVYDPSTLSGQADQETDYNAILLQQLIGQMADNQTPRF